MSFLEPKKFPLYAIYFTAISDGVSNTGNIPRTNSKTNIPLRFNRIKWYNINIYLYSSAGYYTVRLIITEEGTNRGVLSIFSNSFSGARTHTFRKIARKTDKIGRVSVSNVRLFRAFPKNVLRPRTCKISTTSEQSFLSYRRCA